jgi:Flp pilus assembly CpaF family ATPase
MTGSEKRHAEINRLLEGMRPWLADEETLSIVINPPANNADPHTMWVDTRTGVKRTDVLWKPMHILNLGRSIASEVGQQFDGEHPIMRGQLPDDGSHVT